MTAVGPTARYRAVLWDFDGTLTRRPDMWCTSIAEACQQAGAPHVVPTDFDDTAYLYLPWNTAELSHRFADAPDAWWHAFLTAVEPLITDRVDRSVVDVGGVLRQVRRLALDSARYELITPSADAVDRLAARGVPQFVLSNHVPELEEIVASLFPGRFQRVWSSGRVGFEKPRPEIFQYALKQLPFDPHDVLMVGDDHYRDLEPARQTGMRALHVSEVEIL